MVRCKSHWIFESPLANKSLKGTVERDTVKGNRWRPAKTESTIRSHTFTRWGTKLANSRTIMIHLNWKSINGRIKVCLEAMGKCRTAAMTQRYYLYYEEKDYVYVCIWCIHALDVCLCWMEGKRECVLWGVLGGVPERPQGDLTLLLSLYAFLKELYSFYLRKRDQPRGKWGQRWETYDTTIKSPVNFCTTQY